MSVSVTPQEFKFVAYDAAMIQRVAEELASSLGLEDRNLQIEVDETTPLSRTRVEIGDNTISIRAESGAFEDTKRPRQQIEVDETTPLSRTRVEIGDNTISIRAESGAFEDTKRPRQQRARLLRRHRSAGCSSASGIGSPAGSVRLHPTTS